MTNTAAAPGPGPLRGETPQPRNDRADDGPEQPDMSADRDGGQHAPASDRNAGRSAVVPQRRRPVRSWPLLVLAAPAMVAVWSGWVGIGQMTGFGEIHPLPGIWNSLHLDTAVTLPIGVETYAAFALRVWLAGSPMVSDRTRRFARRSAIAALLLGMAGQVAYHLLTQAGMTRAPWEVTTAVACLPVLVLGMGSGLAHLLRSDAGEFGTAQSTDCTVAGSGLQDQLVQRSYRNADRGRSDDHVGPVQPDVGPGMNGRRAGSASLRPLMPDRAWSIAASGGQARPPARARLDDAQATACGITACGIIASGQHISRRSLRAAGLRGSNADLGMLARLLRGTLTPDPP